MKNKEEEQVVLQTLEPSYNNDLRGEVDGKDHAG
jgi:hypothetical protein